MNGATEATLAELVAVAQSMNVNLIKLQGLFKNMSSSGSGSGGSTTGSSAGVTSSLNPLSMAFNVATGAVNAVGSVLGVMGSILGKVVGVATGLVSSLYNLGVATAISGTKISDFYAAFEKIPLLGIGFGILSDIIRYQEQLLEFFQQIAMSGATFSGSLTQMKSAATRSYMTMQDFATVVKENSEIFAQMGGTAMTSINKFVDIQNKLLGPKSEYANMLYGMGYTAKTTGDLLAYYMKIQATVNKEEQQSTEEIIKGTAEYARELNLLSQLTGTNAKELQKQADAIAREDAYRMYKTTIGGDKAAREMQVITTLTRTAGKEIAEMYRDSYAGILARTEEQRKAGVMVGKPLYDFLANIRRMTDAGASQAQLTEYARQESVKMGMIVNQTGRAFQGIGPAMSSMYKPVVQLAEFYQSQKDLPTLAKNEAAARKNMADAAKGNAAALERAEQGIRNFGEKILGIASQILGPFIPILQAFANGIVSLTADNSKFMIAIRNITNWMTTAFTELKNSYKEGGISSMFKTLFAKLSEGWQNTKNFMAPFITELAEWWKKDAAPVIAGVMESMLEWIIAALRKNSRVMRFLFGETSGEKISSNQSEIEDLRAKIKTQTEFVNSLRAKDPNDRQIASRITSIGQFENRIVELTAEIEKLGGGTRAVPARPAPRHGGTIGMTGSWWEKQDATLNVKAGEGVFRQDQMAQYIDASGQNNLAESIQQLNSLVALQVKYAKETAEYARRNVDATKNLDGNLFARA